MKKLQKTSSSNVDITTPGFPAKTKRKNGRNDKAKPRLESDWNKQLSKLVKWVANTKKYSILFKDVELDSVDFDKKEIVISSSHASEVAFYCLLHELGHIILIEDKRKYRHAYGVIWDSFSQNSLTLRVTTLQEELDAWREGLKLAKSLNMKICRRKYEIVKAKCIATYLPWASCKSALYENK